MTTDKFSDGSSSGYVELPVPAAWLTWTRGDAKLAAIKDADPGAYFGGWKAFVKGRNEEEIELPKLPIPVVTRTSEDGKHQYQVYSTNVLNFVPVIHRTRFELRTRVKDEETGREYEKTAQVSKTRKDGFTPNRQVFGVVYSADLKQTAYAVLKVNKWSSFITFEKAGQAWQKIQKSGHLAIRQYGTIGDKGAPKFDVYGQSRSTPIEAIGLSTARFIPITAELDAPYESVVEWKNCPMWNRDGEVEEPAIKSIKEKFLALCTDMGLTNVEIEQILAENEKEYSKALAALSENPFGGE